jgi:hypothetical protein
MKKEQGKMDNNRASYIIDKGNNVVVAEITGCLFDAEDMMNNRFIPSVTSGFQLANTGRNKFDMNRNYKAVAKLHPDDQWDEKRGKKIANDKLTEVYHHSMNKRLAKYAKDFRKIADNIDKYLEDRHFNATKS